jgi:L-asparaginase II
MSNPVLVLAERGGAVESFHRGALAIVDARGRPHRWPWATSSGRSSRARRSRCCRRCRWWPAARPSAGPDDEELALACASHGGEPAHAATAAAMLAKAGLDADALECGAHWPFDGALRALARGGAPSALHNNCSGKHAGFVCLGCLMAASAGRRRAPFVRGYVKPDHPVMREVTAALQAATGFDLAQAPVGTDGCSIPTYAIPLRRLALGFARLATGRGPVSRPRPRRAPAAPGGGPRRPSWWPARAASTPA